MKKNLIEQETNNVLSPITAIIVFFAFTAIIAIVAGQGFIVLKKADKEMKTLIHKASHYRPAFEIVMVEEGVYKPRFFKKKDKDNK